MGIRLQLQLPLLVMVAGTLAMGVLVIRSNLIQEERLVAERIGQVAQAVTTVSIPRTNPILQLMKAMTGADLLLIDAMGRTLTAEDGIGLATIAGPPRHWQTTGSFPSEPRVQSVQGVDFYVREVPFGPNPQEAPILVILIPKPPLIEELKRAAAPVGFPLLLGGGVGLLLALGLARGLTRRIRRVNEQTRVIAAGDFTPHPIDPRQDEIGELSLSVNKMAQQLDAYRERIRGDERLKLLGQVGSGLAHQLRNNTAGAKLAIQLHARGCPAQKTDDLKVALRQLSLAQSQINRFLDRGQPENALMETVDLGDLAAEWVDMVAPQCEHKGISMQWRRSQAVVRGDRHHLGDLIHNLLINALEAAGPGGTVRVDLISSGDKAILEIRDDGPGPSDAIAHRLFEPFATDKKEGIGLGLSVSRKIARHHGGDITWHREPPWTVFRFEMPLQAQPDEPGEPRTVESARA